MLPCRDSSGLSACVDRQCGPGCAGPGEKGRSDIMSITIRARNFLLSRRGINPTRIVAASFGCIILLGALLLTLPIASRSGMSVGFFDALFTATSATCVTGLITVDTWVQWSLFGQIVIIAMIQLGGLGFMTVITMVSFVLHRRIGLSERLIMVSTFNLNDLDGVVRMVRHALMGTFLIEGIGAVILSICFIPTFGLIRGVWHGIFHAISAFCNAGFDLMESTALSPVCWGQTIIRSCCSQRQPSSSSAAWDFLSGRIWCAAAAGASSPCTASWCW